MKVLTSVVNKMITYPNAKINLGLNIVEKRPDGYHNLETIFYPINLQDALEVNKLEEESTCRLKMSGIPIEGDSNNNLVVKAYHLLKNDFPDMPSIQIHMFKHIPTGAGLGGGSADAAFMIKLLNEKFKLNLSIEKMEEYAAQLGADCAFFIQNKPVFAKGIGNIFEPIQLSLKGFYIILVKPDIFVSTKDAFSHIIPCKPSLSLKEVIQMPIETWRATMKNDFENSVFQKFPEIAAIKDKLYDLGALYASMSGSGSSVFGIFREQIAHVDEIFNGCFCRQRLLE